MRIRPEVSHGWPKRLEKATGLGVTAVVLAITLAACTAPASSQGSSTSVSIHISGSVTANYTRGCVVGHDSIADQATVLFPSAAKVSGSTLNLVMYVPKTSSSTTYSASSIVAAVRLTTVKSPTYAWANNNYPGVSGTLTVSGGGSGGSIDMMMVPTPLKLSPTNRATGTVQVQGNWLGCK